MCSPGTMAMLSVLGCLAHTGEVPSPPPPPLPCWSNSPTMVRVCKSKKKLIFNTECTLVLSQSDPIPRFSKGISAIVDISTV